MNMKRNLFGAVAFCAALSAPLSGLAAVVVHTSQANFLSAVSGPATDTFEDFAFPNAALGLSLARTVGVYSYTASAPGNGINGLFSAGTAGDRWLSTNIASDPLTLNTFSSNVFGVGGFFFTTDDAGLANGGDVSVATSDGVVTSTSLTATSPGSFLGFTSTSQILSVIITADNQGASRWATVNDLILGGQPTTQPPNPAPEPGTLSLIALAAAALVASARRRKSL